MREFHTHCNLNKNNNTENCQYQLRPSLILNYCPYVWTCSESHPGNTYDSLRERWREHIAQYSYWEKLLSVSRWFKSKEVIYFVATTTDVDIQAQLTMAREGLEDWDRQGCSRDCMPKLRSVTPVWLMPLPQCKLPIGSSTVIANHRSDQKPQQSGNQTLGSVTSILLCNPTYAN